jgi:hypothetical protein
MRLEVATVGTGAGIMGHVVEQRPDAEGGSEKPSEVRPGGEVEPTRTGPVDPAPADSAPGYPAPVAPVQGDAEQWRQFQQFQRFQEFLRFQEAQRERPGSELAPVATRHPELAAGNDIEQPPAAPPPRREVPRWLRWLGKKLLGWLIFFLLLALALTWAYQHFFGTDNGNSTESAARMGGGKYHTEEILSKEPYEAVRKVYHHLAQSRADLACGYFDNEHGVQQRFAEDLGFRDCRAAVLSLHRQVTHVNDYAESIHPARYDPNAATVRIDSCDFAIKGGPALGVFTVTEVEMGQWLITGHEPGPRTCPAGGTAAAPSDPTTPGGR